MKIMIEKMLENIPSNWKKIAEEDYVAKNVHFSEAYEIVAVYEVDGEILVINAYPEVSGFVEAYDEQMKEIKNALTGKNWRDVSTINPIKYEYIKDEDEKIYLSVFESYNVSEKVSVQIFFEREDNALGFLTSVRKDEKEKSVVSTINKNQSIKEICSLIKKI
jgi:hypothetical protein